MTLLVRTDRFIEGAIDNYFELGDLGFEPNLAVPVPRPFPETKLEIKTKCSLPDYFIAGNLLFVSDELRAVMQSCDMNAEYLEVITTMKGQPYTQKNYCLLNILEMVPCFDYEQSKFKETRDGVEDLELIVFDEVKAMGHPLFLLGPKWSEANPKSLAISGPIECASEAFAKTVIQAKMTGIVFVRPEHQRLYPAKSYAWVPSDN